MVKWINYSTIHRSDLQEDEPAAAVAAMATTIAAGLVAAAMVMVMAELPAPAMKIFALGISHTPYICIDSSCFPGYSGTS